MNAGPGRSRGQQHLFGLRGRGRRPGLSGRSGRARFAVPASLGHARESLLQAFEGRAVARLVGAQRSAIPQVRRRLHPARPRLQPEDLRRDVAALAAANRNPAACALAFLAPRSSSSR